MNLGLIKDLAINSDSAGGYDIVTSDHTDGNTGLIDISDGAWNFGSNDIHNAEDADEGKTLLLNVLDFLIDGFVVLGTTLVFLKIFVGKSNSAESLCSVGVDNIIDSAVGSVVNNLNVTVDIEVVAAASLHDFRGTLNDESLVVAVLGLNALHDS